MNGTINQQGRLISTGETVELQIRSDVDWMHVRNYTVAEDDQTVAIGVEYFWQRGMEPATGIIYKKSKPPNC